MQQSEGLEATETGLLLGGWRPGGREPKKKVNGGIPSPHVGSDDARVFAYVKACPGVFKATIGAELAICNKRAGRALDGLVERKQIERRRVHDGWGYYVVAGSRR